MRRQARASRDRMQAHYDEAVRELEAAEETLRQKEAAHIEEMEEVFFFFASFGVCGGRYCSLSFF